MGVLSDRAFRLFFETYGWAVSQDTHGIVLQTVAWRPWRWQRAVQELLDAGLWRPLTPEEAEEQRWANPHDYMIVDFSAYTASKPRGSSKTWRTKVLERDGNRCQHCGSTEKLHAHHIKSWKDHASLRKNIDNGITLCDACHMAEHRRQRSG